MSFINKIVNKIGEDKVLHFLVGALITALQSPIGWIGVLIGAVLVLGLSVLKEYTLDEKPDIWDIVAAACGIAFSCGYYALISCLI